MGRHPHLAQHILLRRPHLHDPRPHRIPPPPQLPRHRLIPNLRRETPILRPPIPRNEVRVRGAPLPPLHQARFLQPKHRSHVSSEHLHPPNHEIHGPIRPVTPSSDGLQSHQVTAYVRATICLGYHRLHNRNFPLRPHAESRAL